MRHNAITLKQIKKIHALKNRLGWSDEQYREYLLTEGDGFAMSCKDLSEAEAERLIRKMELVAVAKGVWKRFNSPSPCKYDELSERPGMASPKQIRMIEAMWKDVSKYKNKSTEAKERALRHFLHRIAGVDDIRFLESRHVCMVVKAILSMKGKRKGGR